MASKKLENMNKNQNLLQATKNSFNGLRELLKESSSKRELALCVITITLFCFKPNVYTVLMAVLSLILLSIESLNTAIEKICDHVNSDTHPEIKKIKDLGAAAVLIIVIAIVLIFIRYLSSYQ